VKGELYIIGTPIGNLGDVTPRSKTVLASLDVLFCEDTRVSAQLLSLLGLSLPLRALSDDLPDARVAEALELVQRGRKVGFVSDAGMPGVSDPARRLCRAAWERGITPRVVPGVSAVSMLLAACPFVDGPFHFAGFAGRRGAEREAFVQLLVQSPLPTLFFEGRSRVHALLDAICSAVEADRRLMIGREMTKLHEQLLCFAAADWPALRGQVPDKGEFTLALEGARPVAQEVNVASAREAVARLEKEGFSKRDAVRAYAACLELSVNEVKHLIYGQG